MEKKKQFWVLLWTINSLFTFILKIFTERLPKYPRLCQEFHHTWYKKSRFSFCSLNWMLRLMKFNDRISKAHKSIIKVIINDKISSAFTINFRCHQLLSLKHLKRLTLNKKMEVKSKITGTYGMILQHLEHIFAKWKLYLILSCHCM